MGCSGNCYPLFSIVFKINPPIIAIGMETESETGSRNAPNIPPKIVQTTARTIISGLHNFQNIFSAAKSYVVQHGFVFDWIKISIAHLFGIEKRKRNSGFPRLLIRKHEKVSKINVFKGREHGTKSKNLILTGTKGADVKISALFLSPRHRQPPYGVFSYPCLYPPEKCIN